MSRCAGAFLCSSAWSRSAEGLGPGVLVPGGIYIYIVCNYSQPVAAAVATDIYIYIHVYILYIHIYQYQSGLCCSTSPACTLLGYVHGSSAVFCLASVGHAGVADRLHLEVVKQPAKYVTVLKAFPDPWGRQDFKNTHLLKRGRSPGPAQ